MKFRILAIAVLGFCAGGIRGAEVGELERWSASIRKSAAAGPSPVEVTATLEVKNGKQVLAFHLTNVSDRPLTLIRAMLPWGGFGITPIEFLGVSPDGSAYSESIVTAASPAATRVEIAPGETIEGERSLPYLASTTRREQAPAPGPASTPQSSGFGVETFWEPWGDQDLVLLWAYRFPVAEAKETTERPVVTGAVLLPGTARTATLLKQGAAKLKAGDFDGAMIAFDRALKLNPNDPNVLANRSLVSRQRNDPEGSVADLDRALKIDPENATALVNRGVVKAEKGDFAGAIADFNRADELEPQDVATLANRGMARADGGDAMGALADYERALVLDPRNATALNARGVSKGMKEDFAGAEADFARAIEINPNDSDFYSNRGLARAGMHNYNGAIADYDLALKLDPKSSAAFANRGLAREAKGDLEGALADYDRAIALDPKDTETKDLRAETARKLSAAKPVQ